MPRTLEMMAEKEMDSWGIAEYYSINCKRKKKQEIFSDSDNNSRNMWTNKHSSVA